MVVMSLVTTAFLAVASDWVRDILGCDYQMRYVNHPDDYSGHVRSTIVRHKLLSDSRYGVLYIHGYNDYFFQIHMSKQFVDHGINFYAVDLRKYGRSIMPGQKKFEVRDLHEYFADIDSALVEMENDGIDNIVLFGHSTGGLIAALYINEIRHSSVNGLILNSPFLEWNFNGFMRKIAIPSFAALGRFFPTFSISQGDGTGYGESLLKEYHGEWTYNTDWKLLHPQKVESSWVRAISSAQDKLKKYSSIDIPVLLLYSSGSVSGNKWTPEHLCNDAVLNVKDIARYGRSLGNDVTECTIEGGMHDLSLSSSNARKQFFDDIFMWLSNKLDWVSKMIRA